MLKVIKHFNTALLALTALTLGVPHALAQDANYPNKPIRLIVPVPPGGAADGMARLVAEHLQSKWGQPVTVDNKPGAGSAVGLGLLAKSPADGYTIGLGNIAANAINPALQPTAFSYHPVNDFAAISLVGVTPLVLVVHAEKVPAKTIPEFIAYLKANPGKLAYGSSGVGSSLHIAMELFLQKTDTKMLHVPYKGSAPMMTDLIGGQVIASMDAAATSWPQVQAGKLRALGVASLERSAAAPDIPTIAEVVPGFEAIAWMGLLGPAGTPTDIVSKINSDIRRVLQSPEASQKLRELAATPGTLAPQAFADFVRQDTEKWRALVKSANIKAD